MSATGIVLAGGKSSRMGTEKGLQLLCEKPLIQYAIDALLPVCDTIIISSNSDTYSSLGYKVVADELPDIGPMGGIYSALKLSKTEHNLVLSCDLPFVKSDLLHYFLLMASGFQVVVPWEGNQHYEPLCAFYNKGIVAEMENFLKESKYKLPELFNYLKVNKLNINHSLPFYSDHLFFNVNSKHDLLVATNMMQSIK